MKKIYDSVIAGELEEVVIAVNQALAEGISPGKIISEGLIKAMDEVGEQMKNGDLYVPEVLIAAEAMKQGLLIVKPLLVEGESYSLGKVVIGTVAGDLHDIGKNLVAMLLESSGFDVIDLGIDVSPEKFLAAVAEHNPQIVGLSALLTTTMASMHTTIKTISKQHPQVKTMIGGAPVSQEFADEIGAGGYASDGAAAVSLAKQLLN
jgi:5-methyltetrahydrofolate--homocysteine methyltransferase